MTSTQLCLLLCIIGPSSCMVVLMLGLFITRNWEEV